MQQLRNKPQRPKTLGGQEQVALAILGALLWLSVYWAIDFHNETPLKTDEVDDLTVDVDLTLEFPSIEAFGTEFAP